MDFITQLFTGTGASSILVYLCLTAFIGVAVGKLELKGVKLGIAGVLFTGLALASIKAQIGSAPLHAEILQFVKEFGLILFIYAIGIDVGPRFVSSLRNDGFTMNMLALGIIFLGFSITVGIYFFTDFKPVVIAGIMSGAVTNTPGLGAAQEALSGNKDSVELIGMAYAVAYPFGVLGVILTMVLIRKIFCIDIKSEENDYNNQLRSGIKRKLESVEITVTNPDFWGKKISEIKELFDNELAISCVQRGESFVPEGEKEILQKGDIIHGVSSTRHIQYLQTKIGEVKIENKKEVSGLSIMFNVLVTNRKLAGKTIDQVGIYRRYEANITRIFRAGMEILPTKNTTLELGDTVRIVGKKALVSEIQKEIGNSVTALTIPNTLPVFLGIFLGVVLGSVPIFIPGLPASTKLGFAGGLLIVALILGHKGRIGKLDFYMNPGAIAMLRELGIILFLGCIGLSSGTNFIKTVSDGGYIWMLYGVAITFIPVMTFAVIARLMKFNYLKICGIITGATTNPSALEYANSLAPSQAQSTVYATIYPLAMFLRILLIQIFILVTL